MTLVIGILGLLTALVQLVAAGISLLTEHRKNVQGGSPQQENPAPPALEVNRRAEPLPKPPKLPKTPKPKGSGMKRLLALSILSSVLVAGVGGANLLLYFNRQPADDPKGPDTAVTTEDLKGLDAMNTTVYPRFYTFGNYKWRVLATEGNRMLLITEDIIEYQPYNKYQPYNHFYTDATWATCTLHEYLNNKFYNSFTAEDRARIAKVTIETSDSSLYGTKGGESTGDYIFLLSEEEAERYFQNDVDRVAKYSNFAAWWWLRSPGLNQDNAAFVDNDGSVYLGGFNVDNTGGGVRPALLLNL